MINTSSVSSRTKIWNRAAPAQIRFATIAPIVRMTHRDDNEYKKASPQRHLEFISSYLTSLKPKQQQEGTDSNVCDPSSAVVSTIASDREEVFDNKPEEDDTTPRKPSPEVVDNSDKNTVNDSLKPAPARESPLSFPARTRSKPQMYLSWCSKNSYDDDDYDLEDDDLDYGFCKVSSQIREMVIGPNNHITFDGPATGQVMYQWSSSSSSSSSSNDDENEQGEAYVPSVYLLVKRDDDIMLKVAANAVKELLSGHYDVNNGDHTDDETESSKSFSTTRRGRRLRLLLDPDLAAKLKHYFGVDADNGDDTNDIQLFEPTKTNKRQRRFGWGLQNASANDKPASIPITSPPDWTHAKNEGQHSDDAPPKQEQQQNPDLIVTLGGDGLLMHASTLFPGPMPPTLCVAGGSLGFLTPFPKEEMVNAIWASLGSLVPNNKDSNEEDTNTVWDYNNDPISPSTTQLPQLNTYQPLPQIRLSMRMRLDCRILNPEGVLRARFNVLNEVVIDRGSSPYLASLECFIDNVHLTTVQADGIIFSTPTGSTAYSMSAGGSVVHPAVPAILVTPICPHVLSFRSMVFPDHVTLRCYVPLDARSEVVVAFDGKHRRELQRGDSVQIQMSVHPVPTINRMDHSSDWLGSLKSNFNFNTRAVQKPL